MVTALGIYMFAGGFTQGLVSRKVKVRAVFEDSSYPGTDTHLANFPDIPIYFRNDEPTWPELEQYANQVELIVANPPCAIVSPIGRSMKNGRDNWKSDPRLSCWTRSYNAIELNPDILAIESVPGMFSPKKARPFIEDLTRDAMKRGYSVTCLLHDGGLLGLPQHRRRFFFIAHKHRIEWPKLTKRPPPVGEVLGKVKDPGWFKPLTEDQKKVYGQLKVGRVSDHNGGTYPRYERFKTAWCRIFKEPPSGPTKRKGRPLFMHSRLHAQRPANAFVGNYLFHPTSPRHLGHNEMKALCGYPLKYKLVCRNGRVATMLAQAVLPPVGAWIADMAKNTLATGLRINQPLARIRDIMLRKRTGFKPHDKDMFDDDGEDC